MRLRLLTVALPVAAYFAGSLAWLHQQRPRSVSEIEAGSSLDASPRGLSLAYAYLERRPEGAERLGRPLDTATVAPSAMVFRVRPRRDSPAPTDGEAHWLAQGGRLVLALDESSANPAVVKAQAAAVRKVYPVWPGVDRLVPAVWRSLHGSRLVEGHAVFVAGEAPLVARVPRGRGELILMAAPELLENGRLGEADHLALLTALAAGRRAYFDERAHGLAAEDTGIFELLAGWGLGPFLVVLGVLAVAAFWRARTRLGAPDADPADLRSEAVDLVDSLGSLYHRSLPGEAALGLYRGWLARAVSLRTGLKGKALDRRVAELAGAAPPARGPQGPLGEAELRQRLHKLNDAFRRITHAQPR
jgi:uncharacterized protein DUF4350